MKKIIVSAITIINVVLVFIIMLIVRDDVFQRADITLGILGTIAFLSMTLSALVIHPDTSRPNKKYYQELK